MEAVVAAQGSQGTQSDGVGEEYLGASINPDLGHKRGCQGGEGSVGGVLSTQLSLACSPAPQPAWTSRVSGSRQCRPELQAVSLRGPAAG